MFFKKIKKLTAIALSMAMTLSMGTSVFAATDSVEAGNSADNVYVQFAIDKSAADAGAGITLPTTGYTDYDYYMQSPRYTVDKNAITTCPVTKPAGFKGLFDGAVKYVPTAFDAIYNAAVVQAGEKASEYISDSTPTTAFMYGFDTEYTKPGENGIFVRRLSNLQTTETGSGTTDDGKSYWEGYSWTFYVVPADVTVADPLDIDPSYESSLYPNNIDLQSGKQYYMVYKYNYTEW